jgi:O-antigen/teichoic acid export membrane protein
MTQKKFIGNLGLLIILNLLIKPFWILGIDRTVQNTVGSENYGLFFALFNFSFLLNIFLDAGITGFNNRHIARNPEGLPNMFGKIVVLKLILAILYTILTIGAGMLVGYGPAQMEMLYFLCFNQFLLSFILYFRSNISGLHLFRTDRLLSVLDRLLMIVICAVLLWGNITHSPFKIEWFIYSQTAAYGITAIVGFVLNLYQTDRINLVWDGQFVKNLLKKSLPFASLVLLMSFYSRIDSVMLERLLPNGDKQAGIYALGFRILDAANMLAYLFAVLLLPIFSRLLKTQTPDQMIEVKKLCGLSFKLIMTLAIPISVGSFYYQKEIMASLYVEEFANSAQVFGILMGCFIAVSISYIYGTLLTANGNLKALNYMAISGILLNMGMNFILIPKYEATGAAFASLLTQIATAFLQICIVQYYFRFKVSYLSGIMFFCFLLSVLIGGYTLKNSGLTWDIGLLVFLIYSFAIAWITRMVNVTPFVDALYRKE